MLKGLTYARRKNFRVVELHVDLMVVAKVLTSNGRVNPCGMSLSEKICHLFQLEWEVVVRHSYREGNQCAYALANYGCLIGYYIPFFNVCLS